jgi:flagellar hook-associated protein 1 FlgK
MRSAFFPFHIAASGLHAARANLNTISHNIANAEIPGFSRQQTVQSASRPLHVMDGKGMYGTGATTHAIIQNRNQFLDMKFWQQRSIMGEHATKATHLSFVETVFNNLPGAGVLQAFDGFFNRMYDLAGNAPDATFRTNVITGADALTEMVRHNALALQRQQIDINREIADVVMVINSLGTQIVTLNKQIADFERDGANANDLRDRRALLIDELSQYVNVEVRERDFSTPDRPNDRRLTVMINGSDFVRHESFHRLELVPRTPEQRRNEMDVDELYDITFAGGAGYFDIYNHALRGVLRGLIDLRDGNNSVQTNISTYITQSTTETIPWPITATFIGPSPNITPNNIPNLLCITVSLTDIDNNDVSPKFMPQSGIIEINGVQFEFNRCIVFQANLNVDIIMNQTEWETMITDYGPIEDWNIVFPNTPEQQFTVIITEKIPFNTLGAPTSNYKGIPFYMNQLNQLVRTFARAINEGLDAQFRPIPGAVGHINGFDIEGRNRSALFFTYTRADTETPATWTNASNPRLPLWRDAEGRFFTEQGDPALGRERHTNAEGFNMYTMDLSGMNALNFIINPELIRSNAYLAASSHRDQGESNNAVIQGFNLVGTFPHLFREGRLEDFIIAISDHLAIDANQALNFALSFDEITMQTHNQRLSVKGVDINEEMMDLIRFQHMFQAASRLINVIDSIYDTLINRLGVS